MKSYDPESNHRMAEFELEVVKAWERTNCTPSEYGLSLSKLIYRHMQERAKHAKSKKK